MRTAFLAIAVFALGPGAALAQTPSPAPSTSASPAAPSEFARDRVDAILRTGHADPGWFAAVLLAQVPAAQIDAIVAQLKTALGEYKRVAGAQGDYTAYFEKGTEQVLVHLDADNKIDGILFKPPKMQASLEDALRGLRPAGGTLSYVLIEGRSEQAALASSEPLAVGSAFKLAVLAALRDEIARGRRHWADVVPLAARWKSLPSGVIRTWPDGTPLTLATYATEMISISDNTAADALVRLAGPGALEPYASRNVPFLTTREMFILKSVSGTALRAGYLSARTPAERGAVLRRVDALPLPRTIAAEPINAIEWHYTVRELCQLMGRVADLPLMSINAGVADPESFSRVAYKGGSDRGAINLTTQVTTKRGSTLCFSATLNDTKAIDERAFESAYGLVISALANR